MSPLGRLASGALIFAAIIPVEWTDAASLKEATVTQAYNVVKVVAPSREDRSAAAGDRITGDQGVRTGQASRAELEFIDRTLTRLGANTIFTFENGTREMQLEQGTMLLQVPKAAGGAKIRTAAITAAITGTTILLEYSPDFNPPPGSSKPKRKGHVKVIVLEGTLRLYLNKRMGESVLVKAGQMLITTPDAQQLPESVDVDISKLVDTSLLVNNRYWQNGASSAGSNANPQGGNLSMPLIDREIARQRALVANGTLVETNLGITGRGTIVMIQSNDPQSQINTRTTVAQSQVTAPAGVPTNPGSFTVDAGTTIKTNPPMQTGSTRATGAVYLGRNINGPFSMFGLGPARPFDATAGFAGSFFGDGNFPSLGVAVFRYGGTLTLAGSVNFDVTGGRTSVALIANSGITTSTNEFVFNLAGLTELLLATANGPLTIGSAASISGTDTRLDLYARGAASDLTIDGFLSLGNGALFAAAERDILLNGTINSASLILVSGGSIDFNDRIFTGPVTARAGLDITMQAEAFLQAAGPVNFTAGRNLMINGRLSAPTVSLTAASLLTFGGNNLDFEQLTSLTAAGGSIRLTSDLTLSNGATATLTSANGIDAAGFDLAGTNLTLTLTGGTLVARTVSAESITASNATIDAFVTAGTFNVNGGTVLLTGGGAGSGNFNIASGATLDFAGGTQTLSAPGSVSGAGNVRFSGGNATLGGIYNVAGLTTINGGAVNFDGSAAAGSVALSAGTLGGAGIFHVTGTFAWTGGTMAGPGTTITDGLFSISGAAGETISGGRLVIADAATNFSGGNLNFISSSGPAGGFTNNGTFNALDDADIVLTGTGSTPIFANSAGATFVKSGTGTTTDVGIAFTNAGTVNVTGGTLSFSNTYTQTAGTLALLGGNVQTTGTLALQGGLLAGAGSVFGNVLSGANIQPALAAGGLNVSGNLSLLSASQLSFQIGGLVAGTQYSVLNVGGSVALNGTLLVSFANGFQNSVANGNTFTLMTTGGFSGAFANIVSGSRLLTSDGFGSFLVTYSGTTLTLSNFISGSANFATWLGGTGNWSDATRWSTNPLFPNNGNGGFVFVASLGSGSITQDVAGGVIIEQLQMSGGTLILTNPLRLNSGLQFSGGTIRNGTLNLAGASSQSALMTTAALTINNAGTYDLAFDNSNVFSGGALFTNSGTLIKSTGSGTLTFNNQLNNTGTVSVLNGTLLLTAGGLNAGTYNAAAGATLEFASSNAFNSGSVFSGAGVVQFDNNTDTTFNGTVNNSGRILINAGGNLTRLIIGGDVTLTGGGALTFSGVNAQLTGGFQLTNLNNQIQGFGNLGANLTSFLNQAGGVINANVNAQSLLVDPGAGGFVNQGLLEATNGGLLTLTGNGGGGFNDAGGTIRADGTGSQVVLVNGAVISGGTLSGTNGGQIIAGDTAFLSNVTLSGTPGTANFVIANNADAHVSGTITNTGLMLVVSTGNLSRLILDANTTLNGGGTIILAPLSGTGNLNAQITGGSILTNVDNTIEGSGNLGANAIGIINGAGGIVNAMAFGTGFILSVDPGAAGFVNQGLLEATSSGVLQLTGNGGGGFNNAGGTILANGAGSEVQLFNSVSITAGTLQTLNGGVIRAVGGYSVVLNGLTINGNYIDDNNADTHITGTINNLGSITLNSAGNLSRLILDANTTLTGGGTLSLVGVNAQIIGASTLTNFDNVIHGQGNIGANQTAIINQPGGVIDANVSGQVLYVDPVNSPTGFVNNGLLEATNGGFLQLTNNGGGSFVNNATILASGAGSEVQLIQSVDITGGTLSATNGGLIRALTGQSVFLHNLTLSGPYVNDNNADTHLTGTITNLGSISLNSAGNLSRLILDSDLTLTGGGTVNLNGPNAQMFGGFQLTNVNNVIQGQGNLGANVTMILNQSGGVIDANVNGQGLFVDPINNPNGFVNHGVFEATNGGLLQLTGNGGGAFVNTGSTILASGSGSEIQLLQNVDITGGTLGATGGGIIHNLTGNVAFLHSLTLNGPYVNDNNADTHFTGTITNLASISLNAVGNITRLLLDADVTLTGGGTVNMNGANAQIFGGFQLTNVNNIIQGQGNLGANVMTILNQAGGTIDANVPGQILYVDPINTATGFVNHGVFEATNGGLLQLAGNGGGAFVNTGSTILATGAGSEIQLVQNVDITGGTLSATNGGIIHNLTGNVAFLHSLTLNGPYVNDNNADTHVTGTINNLASISLNSAGNVTRLLLDADSTLTGGGTVNMNGANAQIFGGVVLTNFNNLIQGQGNLGANVMTILNQAAGVIDANVTGQVLFIDPVNSPTGFVNNGLVEATNGGLLQLSGNGNGAFVNNTTISADGIGSEIQLLQNVIITGGTLSATNGGIIHNLSGQAAFLNGLTLVGPYVNDNNADTHITGTIANTGSMSFNSAGNVTRLFLEANSTLTGGGTVNLNGVNAQITGAFQLTNVDNLIQGQGNLGANVGSFVNQAAGVFNANVSGQTMVIDPVNSPTGFVNNGLLEATNGGVLQLTGNGGGAFVNGGTIQSTTGGVLRFDGTITSSGIVDVGGGTLTGTGNYTQTAGTFQVAGGTVQSDNALMFQGGLLSGFGSITASITNSAMIRPDLGGAGFAITGNVSLLSGSQLSFQLGGLTQGSQYGFISVNGAVTLGGNLVLSFANGFQNSVTGSNTFTLLTTTGALSGVFANIASGVRLNTSDGFGSFLVTYGGGTLTHSGYISNGVQPGTWTGTTGNWSVGGNWTAGLVPNDTALDVSIDGGRTGTNSNVTLDITVNVRNLTIDAGDRLTILNGAQLTLNGTTLTNNGQITINAGGGKLTLATGSLISGTGVIFLVGGTSQMGSAGTITQDIGHTLQGSGVVNGAFVNNGLVLATGGALNFSGGFTQNAGLLNLTSGTVSSPTAFEINGGSVTGFGTMSGSVNNNGVMQPLFGSGGLGITGALNLGASSSLLFSLGGTILGTQYSLINVSGAVSLDGQVNALFSGGFQTSVTNANVFTILNAGSPLTGLFANVASGSRLTTGDGFGSFLVTYSGNQVILSDYLATITNFVGTNWLSASSGAWTTATNWSSNPFAPNDATPSNGTGYNVTINAAGAPYTITLASGIIIQSLFLNSASATLSLNANANLRLIGDVNLQAGTLAFNAGTLRGGNLNLAGGSLTFTNSGNNILDHVMVNGDFTIATSSGIARLDNGSQISGNVTLSGSGSTLAINQDATMMELTVNMGSAGVNAFVSVEGNHTVTLDNSVFLHGVGNVGQARILGGTGTLINRGTISADVSGQTLTINPNNFTNQGTVEAINGAILTLSGNVTNTGTISADTSTLNLNGTFTGGSVGVVNATNSTVNLGGSFTTAGLSQVIVSGGTLNLSGTLNNGGSTFSLTPNLGVLTLNGGTISGGTVSNASGQALAFSNSGSNVLSNVAVSGGFTIANNGAVRLDNGSQITGTVTLSGSGALLALNQDATMTGLTVNLGSAGVNAFVSVEGNHIVTLDNTIFLHGVGNVGQARIFGGTNTLISQGIISADVSGQTLNINPSNFTNEGTLNAINGAILTLTGNVTNSGTIMANASTLNLNGTFTGGSAGVVNATNSTVTLGGSFTTAGLGQITRSGGTLTLTGTLNNAGSTFSLTPNLGVLTLNGGTISGGTVDNSGGQALAFSNSGSNVLSNLTVSGGLIIANNGGTARLDNSSQVAGTVTLSGTGALLAFNQDATVTGLTVNLGSAGINAFVSVEGNHTVTLDNTIFLHGVGNIGQARIFGGTNTLINQGIISADVSGQTLNINPDNFTNQGTLNAVNGATLTLTGNVTNNGTIVANGSTLNLNGTFTGGVSGVVNATNSTLNLGGTFTTVGLNQITRTGGTLTLTGTLNNAGSTFSLTPNLGVLTLNGGTISGGIVSNIGGDALAFSNSGSNTLSNLTVNGGFTIANGSGTVRLESGTQVTGTVNLTGTGSLLAFNQDATMTGLTVNMGSTGINAFVSVEGNHTVTLDNTVFLHGVGNIGQARIFGGTNALINQGIITADVSGQTLNINPNNFTNQGTLNAINGSILTLTGNVTNSGTIVVNASTLNLNGTFTGGSAGVVNATNATVNLGGTFTTAGLSQITRNGGTLTLSGTLTNTASTFSLTPNLGVLTLNSGTIIGGTVDNSSGQALAFSKQRCQQQNVSVEQLIDGTEGLRLPSQRDGRTCWKAAPADCRR